MADASCTDAPCTASEAVADALAMLLKAIGPEAARRHSKELAAEVERLFEEYMHALSGQHVRKCRHRDLGRDAARCAVERAGVRVGAIRRAELRERVTNTPATSQPAPAFLSEYEMVRNVTIGVNRQKLIELGLASN